uniref:Leucine-rich repeat-containing protein 74 n=1 Tax=Phallusia mammillata TaxID=59560 RepID=A0A6F9DKU4_9ASCI|nr:leucine-rich repeat-containing protein 74 [Phallusia mammillata]
MDASEEYVSCIELPISARALAVLSRAAKRNVQRQHEYVRQHTPRYNRNLKSNCEQRRHATPRYLGHRPEVQSAPPVVCKSYNTTTPFMFRDPPKIVVIGASQEGDSEPNFEKLSLSDEKPAVEDDVQSSDDVEIAYDQQDTSRSSLFHAIEISPVEKPAFAVDTPKSTARGTDWGWVRERLASRESGMSRPESSLTFSDFLDGLEPHSDEYDTDLEDDFVNRYIDDDDPTGVRHYKETCRMNGIAQAKKVIKTLSDQDENFQLNHRCLSDKDTRALASGLKHNTFVKNLNLSNNSLNDKSAGHLSKMLKKNTMICRVDFSQNCMRTNIGSHLAPVLCENSSITHLCLSHNKLMDREALQLCEALRENIALLFLDVSHNQFSDQSGQAIAALLMDNSTLNSLTLSWNMLGKVAAAAVGKALKVNTGLRSLDLSWNGLGDEGAALLGRPLRTNTTLRHLSLAVNHIGPFGAERLSAGVCGSRAKRVVKKSHSCLGSLILDRNPLGRKGIMAFVKHMEKAEKLVDLSIREVVLPPELPASIRSIIVTQQTSIFYEGQPEAEKLNCGIQAATNLLLRIVKQQRVTLTFFMESVDRENRGIPVSELCEALRNLSNVSELEILRIAEHLKHKGDSPIRLQDFLKFVPKVTNPVKPAPARRASRRRSSILKSIPSTVK